MAIGVQESDVWAAADALLHAGEQPTIERVRLHLGRGSPNTVGPHLKAWFKALGARLSGAEQTPSPAPDSVVAAAQRFWETALIAAKDEWQQAIAQERQILTMAQEALAVDRQVLQSEQQRLAQREVDLKAAIYSAREQAAAAQEHARVLDGQLTQSEARVSVAEDRLVASAERERLLQEKVEAISARHRDELSAAEQRHAAHERRWLTDLDAQRQASKKLQEELDHIRKTTSAHQKEHQRVVEDMSEAHRVLEDSLRTAKHEMKSAELRTAALAHTHATLEKAFAAEQSTAASLQQQLQARVLELNQRIAEQGAQIQLKDQQLISQTHTLSQLHTQLVTNLQTAIAKAADHAADDTQ